MHREWGFPEADLLTAEEASSALQICHNLQRASGDLL
jgi:predicted SAM-dependent methyltransferase